MKYSSLKEDKDGKLRINAPIKGINREGVNENQALFLKNTVTEGKSIKTRKGLNAKLGNKINTSQFSPAESKHFKLTEVEYVYEGRKGKIAISDIMYNDSIHIYSMSLIFSDGSIKSIGEIFQQRVDENVFFIPEKISFFVGQPTNGSGIYAFIYAVNQFDNSDKEYLIYESNSDFSGWDVCTDYHIPTIYINGRGNLYEEARSINKVSLAGPKTIETLNMLNGSFRAYYSSDGSSYSFRLPYANLSDKPVICRIYYTTDSYCEWVVYEGCTSSQAIDFMGKKVLMNVNRMTGMVTFMSDSVIYPIPIIPTYRENNIRFQATKDTKRGFNDIVSCCHIVKHGNKNFFAGGNYFNEIYCSDYSNPLYFPECFNNDVGSGDNPITALQSADGKLIVFKEGEIYSAVLKEGKNINKIALLADNGSYFKDMGSFEVALILRDSKCSIKGSLKQLNGFLLWQNKDNLIYVLKNGKMLEISYNVKDIIDEFFSDEEISTGVFLNNYLLMRGQNAVIINFDNDEPVMHFWEFPESINILGIVSDGGNTAFLLRKESTDIVYTAVLTEGSDFMYTSGNDIKSYPIETVIETNRFLEDSDSAKRIKKVGFNLKISNEASVTVGDNKSFLRFDFYKSKNPKDIVTDFYGSKTVRLKIKSVGGITFDWADIYYKVTR